MKYKAISKTSIQQTKYWQKIPTELQESMIILSHLIPFRTNEYVLGNLIDWENIPDDPIYRLNFPHPDILSLEQYDTLRDLILIKKDRPAISQMIQNLHLQMNPNPAGQLTHNVPILNDNTLLGVQHII